MKQKSQIAMSMQRGAISRRDWIATATFAAVGATVYAPVAAAQQTSWVATLKSMEPMTGSMLPDKWAAPVADLVGIILESSKGLRSLDLRGTEPATIFRAL